MPLLRNTIFSTIPLWVFIVFFACSPPVDDRDLNASDQPDKIIKNFIYKERIDGETSWELFAEKATIFEERSETTLDVLKVNFFSGSKPSSVLTSDKGRILNDRSEMEAEGNVKVVSLDNDEKLDTTYVKWTAEDNKIKSDRFVRWETSDAVTTGYGLETDPAMERVQIKRSVRSRMKDE